MLADVLMHRYIITNDGDPVKRFRYTGSMPSNKAHAELLKLLSADRSRADWDALLEDLLTPQERESLAERWHIIRLLHKGLPQREIAEMLGVSISKITRGSRVLQEGRGGFEKALKDKK